MFLLIHDPFISILVKAKSLARKVSFLCLVFVDQILTGWESYVFFYLAVNSGTAWGSSSSVSEAATKRTQIFCLNPRSIQSMHPARDNSASLHNDRSDMNEQRLFSPQRWTLFSYRYVHYTQSSCKRIYSLLPLTSEVTCFCINDITESIKYFTWVYL